MQRVHILKADITKLCCDAIVNAADCKLSGAGGVDLAIHRAAGSEIKEECSSIGHCETGDAVITKGYNLPSRFVIHTAGPIWRGGGNNECQLLRSCYDSCLHLAREHNLRRLAFSAISCGTYRFPLDEGAAIALDAVATALREHASVYEEILFSCLDSRVLRAFSQALEAARSGA